MKKLSKKTLNKSDLFLTGTYADIWLSLRDAADH